MMIIPFSHPFPVSLRGSAVIVGNFDGVHLGHQALIAAAKATGLRVIALSFSPHPREVFSGEKIFTLTPNKEEALKIYGVEALAQCTFNAEFAALAPQDFIDKVLVNWLGAKAVFTGEGFRFGAKRAGDGILLSRQHFAYTALKPVFYNDEVVSSTRIRAALSAGDIGLANALLGRNFSIKAEVVHGRKEGRLLGYPTANMLLPQEFTLKHGVYAVRMGNKNGVASFGVRPMFDNGAPILEAYVFDFKGDLYGQVLEVQFIEFLRDEAKFQSLEALIAQMNQDSLNAIKVLTHV